MLINKVKAGSKVVLQAEKSENSIEFESIVVFGQEEGLFIEPILYDNHMINFRKTNEVLYTATVVNNEDSKLYIWPDITIKAVMAKGRKLYHLLVSEEDIRPINRRDTFRLPLGLAGAAQIGTNKKVHDIYVRDISATGIAFICKDKIELPAEDTIHIIFEDKDLNIKLNIRCMQVRTAEANDKTLYGCRFTQRNDEIYRYIQRRQQYNQAKKNNLLRKSYV